MAKAVAPINFRSWVEKYRDDFHLPVNNKLMHEDQLMLMFIKGPNDRKDFHVQRGEELFMQLDGSITLEVVEHGKHKTVPVNKGQIALVPARVPHSPRRQEGSLGFVAVRLRDPETEFDCIRWYVEENGQLQPEVLYEDWIYSDDVAEQPVPQIKKFLKSEQCRTGRPIPGAIPAKKPYEDDSDIDFPETVDIPKFINKHRQEIDSKGRKSLFHEKFQSRVYVYGEGQTRDNTDCVEVWIVQWEGSSVVDVEGEGEIHLTKNDTLLVPQGRRFSITQKKGSMALTCAMDPFRSTTWSRWRRSGSLTPTDVQPVISFTKGY